MNSRLVIVDRSLTDERGHHFALTKVVTAGALAHGLQVSWYTNTAFNPALAMDGVHTRGVFAHSTYERFRKEQAGNDDTQSSRGGGFRASAAVVIRVRNSLVYRVTKMLRKSPVDLAARDVPVASAAAPDNSPAGMARALADALAVDGIGADDHVLVHTTDGEMYRVLLQLALTGALVGATPRLHLVTPYDSGTMPHYAAGLAVDRVIRYLDLFNLIGSKIFLYAEHAALARDLATRWGVPVDSLPIPPPTEALVDPVNRTGPLTIAYLGAAREEKGFLLLPDIIDRSLEEHGSNLRFIIQCSPQIVGYTAKIEAAIARLKEHPAGRVRLIEKGQAMSDYYAVLREADVILACYDREKYKVRGSGIAVEALVFGSMLIASPETSPAVIAGRAAVTASSIDEIVSRIREILHSRTEFARTAAECRAIYLRENSANAYVARLLARRPERELAEAGQAQVQAASKPAAPDVVRASQNWRNDLNDVMSRPANGTTREPAMRLLGRQ